MPTFRVTSSSCGIGRPLHFMVFAVGGGGEPCAIPCAIAGFGLSGTLAVVNAMPRAKSQMSRPLVLVSALDIRSISAHQLYLHPVGPSSPLANCWHAARSRAAGLAWLRLNDSERAMRLLKDKKQKAHRDSVRQPAATAAQLHVHRPI